MIPPVSITAPPSPSTSSTIPEDDPLEDDPPLGVPEVIGTGILGVLLISLLAWWRIRKAEDDD